MSYRVFLSFTDADRLLATELDHFLNNEFGGNVDTCFSASDVRAGHKWKNWIKKNIAECDAVVVLLTKNSLAKPWIYIEWSAFWCADKEIYVLKTDEIRQTDLINPMQDSQYGSITDEESFKGFIHNLSDEAGHKKYPYKNVPQFIAKTAAIIEQQKNAAIVKLAADIEKDPQIIPTDDEEKKKIAMQLISSGNIKVLKPIFDKIGNINIQADLVISLVHAGKTNEIQQVITDPENTDATWKAVSKLTAGKIEDREATEWLIKFLPRNNNSGLRNIALNMIGNGLDKDPIFQLVINEFGNMTVLEKVSDKYISEGQFSNENLFKICARFVKENGSAARNTGIKLIDNGQAGSAIFEFVFKGLIENGKLTPARRLLDVIKEKSPDFYVQFESILNGGKHSEIN